MIFDTRIYDAAEWERHAGPTRAERLALRILEILPDAEVTRTSEAIQLRHGGSEGIVVLVTGDAFEIRLPTIEWTYGSHGPRETTRHWKRVEVTDADSLPINDLVSAGLAARISEFQQCRICGERVAIEHRHEDVCHGCAERHLGVVH